MRDDIVIIELFHTDDTTIGRLAQTCAQRTTTCQTGTVGI